MNYQYLTEEEVRKLREGGYTVEEYPEYQDGGIKIATEDGLFFYQPDHDGIYNTKGEQLDSDDYRNVISNNYEYKPTDAYYEYDKSKYQPGINYKSISPEEMVKKDYNWFLKESQQPDNSDKEIQNYINQLKSLYNTKDYNSLSKMMYGIDFNEFKKIPQNSDSYLNLMGQKNKDSYYMAIDSLMKKYKTNIDNINWRKTGEDWKRDASYNVFNQQINASVPDDILTELPHQIQRNRGFTELPYTFIKSWFKDPFITEKGQGRQYHNKGTMEHEAHSIIEPQIRKEHKEIQKYYDSLGRNRKQEEYPEYQEIGEVHVPSIYPTDTTSLNNYPLNSAANLRKRSEQLSYPLIENIIGSDGYPIIAQAIENHELSKLLGDNFSNRAYNHIPEYANGLYQSMPMGFNLKGLMEGAYKYVAKNNIPPVLKEAAEVFLPDNKTEYSVDKVLRDTEEMNKASQARNAAPYDQYLINQLNQARQPVIDATETPYIPQTNYGGSSSMSPQRKQGGYTNNIQELTEQEAQALRDQGYDVVEEYSMGGLTTGAQTMNTFARQREDGSMSMDSYQVMPKPFDNSFKAGLSDYGKFMGKMALDKIPLVGNQLSDMWTPEYKTKFMNKSKIPNTIMQVSRAAGDIGEQLGIAALTGGTGNIAKMGMNHFGLDNMFGNKGNLSMPNNNFDFSSITSPYLNGGVNMKKGGYIKRQDGGFDSQTGAQVDTTNYDINQDKTFIKDPVVAEELRINNYGLPNYMMDYSIEDPVEKNIIQDGANSITYKDFYRGIAGAESRSEENPYLALNASTNALGKYQFVPESKLFAENFKDVFSKEEIKKINNSNTKGKINQEELMRKFTEQKGVDWSRNAFLNNPELQEDFALYMWNNSITPTVKKIKKKVNTTLPDDMIAALVHFQGEANAIKILKGETKDSLNKKNNATPEDYLKTYIEYRNKFKHGGYNNNVPAVGWKDVYSQGGHLPVHSQGMLHTNNQPVRVPGGDITMQYESLPNQVLGIGSTGQKQLMQKGLNYQFPGSQYVDEYPIAKDGGYTKYQELGEVNPDVKEKFIPQEIKGNLVNFMLGSPKIEGEDNTEIGERSRDYIMTHMDSPAYKKRLGNEIAINNFIKNTGYSPFQFGSSFFNIKDINDLHGTFSNFTRNTLKDTLNSITKNRQPNKEQVNKELNRRLNRIGNVSFSDQVSRGTEASYNTDTETIKSYNPVNPEALAEEMYHSYDLPLFKNWKDFSLKEKVNKESTFPANENNYFLNELIKSLGDTNIKSLDSEQKKYFKDPAEIKAKLQSLRSRAYSNKIYDPLNDDITKEQLLELKKIEDSNKYGGPNNLFKIYSDEEILFLLNNIAQQESSTNFKQS